jgi:hypothetical protein
MAQASSQKNKIQVVTKDLIRTLRPHTAGHKYVTDPVILDADTFIRIKVRPPPTL